MRRTWILLLAICASALAEDARDLARQAMQAMRGGQLQQGIALAERAVQADPSCGAAYGARGYARFRSADRTGAIQDYSRAIELEPADPTWLLLRCQCYMSLDEWQLAADDASAGLKAANSPQFASLHGWARINLGEVDDGLAEMDKACASNPNSPAFCNRFDGYFFKADWKEAAAEADRQIGTGAAPPPAYYYKTRALTELGDCKGALQVVEDLAKKYGDVLESRLSRAYVLGTPEAKESYDADRAVTLISSTEGAQSLAHQVNGLARIYLLAGRFHDAVQELENHGRRTNFDTLFLLGAAEFKLGRLAEARKALLDARRLNPYIAKHAARIEGLAEFLKSIDSEVQQEGKADRKQLGEEQATEILTVAELETLLRRFRFERAAKGYEKYAASLASPVRKRQAEQRLAEVRGLASAIARLREQVNSGKLKDLKFDVAGTAVTMTKATDEESFEYSFAQGAGKGVWGALGAATIVDLLEKTSPTPDERFAIGAFQYDLGVVDKGVDSLSRAVKADAKLKTRLDAFVAARRGIDVPQGGFLLYKGVFVTPAEKANLEKGLVLYEGQWVTVADRAQLAKGLMKVGDKWVPRAEGELMKLGYRQYKGQWYSPEDYAALRAKWDAAFEEQTTHYDLRSNVSEDFVKELAKLIEADYEENKKFYGGKEPKLNGKERMTLYAFATYEDYRKYCVDHHSEAEMQAAGFAVSNSNTVVGWDKAHNRQSFLMTMAHEASHLYYFRVCPGAQASSWYGEGMATQMEGFHWDGKAYAYDRLSQERLPFAKMAANNGTQMPLDQLIGGDALTLINSDESKALVFYAECWGVVYFLTHTDNQSYRQAFQQFRDAVDSGKAAKLDEYIKDLKACEAEYVKFVKRL